MDNFQDWLKAEIKRRKWRQADLARASNLDTAVISNLVNGKRGPGEDTCTAIARAFGYPPEVVFRAAGILPPETETNEQIEEALHILKMLDGDDLEEIIQIARLKLERKPQIKKSRRDPARSVLIDK